MTINADIDRIFKDGLQEYSPKVPAYIWDHIEQNLDHRKNRNRRTLIYSIAASVAIIIAFGTGFLITGRQGNNSIDQSSIAVIDSSLINEQAEQEQVQPLADDKEAKELNEVNENKDNATDQTKENQNKQEHKTKAKSIKATSNGTLLPPMFGDERIIPASDSIKNDSASQLADTVNLK